VHVIAARVALLPEAVDVPDARRYAGCVSWVELDTGVDVSGAAPAVGSAAFDARLTRLRSALGEPCERGGG
jgi:hypothetical protein